MRSMSVTPTAIDWVVWTWRLVTSGSRYPKKHSLVRRLASRDEGSSSRPNLRPVPAAGYTEVDDAACDSGMDVGVGWRGR